jgi:mRNA interferase YafQ
MNEEYKYKVVYASQFKRDFKTLNSTEQSETEEIIKRLARGETLDEKYHDHQLQGKLKEFRDCHVRPDLVLVYSIDNGVLELYAYRIGSHSKLYGK